MHDLVSISELSVLVVEPSAMQAKVLLQALAQEQVVSVDRVETGAEALSWLEERPNALVVSAYYLPDMTGAQLIGRMRATAEFASTPFILVSSESRFHVLDPVRQSGASSILPKPFSQEQFHTAIRATLDLLNVDESLEEEVGELGMLRVLLVDDSPMARKYVRQVLSNLGIKTFFEADNGRQAAELLEHTAVDLVVTDYNMPEMDGQALIAHIRHQSWQKSVPVLMVTSETDQGRLAAVEALGVVGMCDKPFEPRVLRSLIKRLLSGG
jgi:two-component system chemotaxis response regulator CheY